MRWLLNCGWFENANPHLTKTQQKISRFQTELSIVIGLTIFGVIQPWVAVAQSPNATATTVTYQVTFAASWSPETHPTEFPDNAHFSPLIGATHSPSATFWLSGTVASPGIEQMAETGATNLLQSEFVAAGAAVHTLLIGPGLATSPAQVTAGTFTVSQAHPRVTLVSMIAPSPDWFVGVHNLPLRNEQGEWLDEVVVPLYPYDAGSDDGTTYTAPNLEPAVHQPIRQISGQRPFSTAPIGTFTFTRIRHLHLPLVHR